MSISNHQSVFSQSYAGIGPDALVPDFNTLVIDDNKHPPTICSYQLPPTPAEPTRRIFQASEAVHAIVAARARPAAASRTTLSRPRPSNHNTTGINTHRVGPPGPMASSGLRPQHPISVTSGIRKANSANQSQYAAVVAQRRRRLGVDNANRRDKALQALFDPSVQIEIHELFYAALDGGFEVLVPDEKEGFRHPKYASLIGGVVKEFAETSGHLLTKEDVLGVLAKGRRLGVPGAEEECRCVEGKGCRSDRVMEGLEGAMKDLDV